MGVIGCLIGYWLEKGVFDPLETSPTVWASPIHRQVQAVEPVCAAQALNSDRRWTTRQKLACSLGVPTFHIPFILSRFLSSAAVRCKPNQKTLTRHGSISRYRIRALRR